MKKRYRLKRVFKIHPEYFWKVPTFRVQMKNVLGIWVTVKSFIDWDDEDFAQREAEELLETLKS